MNQPKLKVPNDVVHLLRRLHPELKRKIRAGFELLIKNPFEGKELKEELKGLRSLRVGRLRIIYRLSTTSQIEIVNMGPRKTIYFETYRLISKKN